MVNPCSWLDHSTAFQILRRITGSIWIANVLDFLNSYASFVVSFSISLYLTLSLGMSDLDASRAYSWYGGSGVIYGVLVGPIIDRIGLKKSVMVGLFVMTIGRFVFAFSQVVWVSLAVLIFVIPFGHAIFDPPLNIAAEVYGQVNAVDSDQADQISKMSFRILYFSANAGAWIALLLTDLLIDKSSMTVGNITNVDCHGTWDLFSGGDNPSTTDVSADWVIGGYTLLFSTAALITTLALFLAPSFKELPVAQPKNRLTWRDYFETFREPNFYILLWFVICLIPVRAMFKYMEVLMPLYFSRTIPCAPWATLLSINPMGIMILTPIVSVVTNRVPLFVLLITGTLISAISPLIMALWPDAPYYLNIIISMSTFTLGESIWSALIGLFILQLSPLNKKGLYGGMTEIPTFLGSIAAGEITGYLLTTYCPVGGDPDLCHAMWIPVTFMSLLTPANLLIMYFVIYRWCKCMKPANDLLLESDIELPIVKQVDEPSENDE